MLGTSLNWLGSNALFQPLLILTDTWKEFGYGSIVYLAAITSIDSTLYEAASIDGCHLVEKGLACHPCPASAPPSS